MCQNWSIPRIPRFSFEIRKNNGLKATGVFKNTIEDIVLFRRRVLLIFISLKITENKDYYLSEPFCCFWINIIRSLRATRHHRAREPSLNSAPMFYPVMNISYTLSMSVIALRAYVSKKCITMSLRCPPVTFWSEITGLGVSELHFITAGRLL